MPPRDPGRDLVAHTLRVRYELAVEEIPTQPQAGPSPDLLVRCDEQVAFVVEVKTLKFERDLRRLDANGQFHGPDRGPERAGKAIDEAARQLRMRPEPRVLAIVNEDIYDVHDLDTAVTGGYEVRQGDVAVRLNVMGAGRIARGRVRACVGDIDLCLWIDARRLDASGQPRTHLRASTPQGVRIAHEHLGAPASGWPRVRFETSG